MVVLVPGLLTGPPEGVAGAVVDPFAGGAADWDALADAVVADVAEPAVLVARSLGTAVAVRAALRSPERVAALVLVRPAVGVEARTDLAELAAAARRLGLAAVWRRLSLPGDPPDGVDLDLLEALGRLPLLSGADELAALRAPSLIVAMAGDRLHPMEVAHLYWRHIPTSRLVNEVPGDPPLELGPAVDRFVAEVL